MSLRNSAFGAAPGAEGDDRAAGFDKIFQKDYPGSQDMALGKSSTFSGGTLMHTPDDGRWRELFPIPHAPPVPPVSGVSVSSRRRSAKVRGRVNEVNSIIDCLNEMYLPGRQADDTLGVLGPTEAHRACHHSIFQDLGKHRKTQSKCTEREAIQELLQSTVSYAGDENLSTVRSYERDLVSLPDCGAEPVSLEQVMDPEGREFLEDPQASMMLNEDEWGKICEHGNNFKPYMDEILQKDRIKYQQFVHDLYDKGMIEFTDTPQDMVTPFFVKKKDGRQRFILDCRGVNKRFQAPPPLALAAGSSWSQVVVPKDEILYCAQSDIKDYFYSLALPLKLRSLFCLPPVGFDLMQEWGVASHLRACNSVDGWIWPRLRVIPMGWSWAMWISQRVHSHLCLQATGLDHSRFLVEGQSAPCLEEGEVALLPYADNLNVLGTDRGKVQETKDRIVTHLRSLGFRVHEELGRLARFSHWGFTLMEKMAWLRLFPSVWTRWCDASYGSPSVHA